MRIFALPNGRIDAGDRAGWMTSPFDLDLREGAEVGPPKRHVASVGNAGRVVDVCANGVRNVAAAGNSDRVVDVVGV